MHIPFLTFHSDPDPHSNPEYLGCLYTGSCLVQPSRRDFTIEELFRMVNVCGLNHMTTYGTYLTPYIQAARKDRAILKLLQEMRTVSYDGVPISVADDDWCFENGIPMIVSIFYFASCWDGVILTLQNNNRTCTLPQKWVRFPPYYMFYQLRWATPLCRLCHVNRSRKSRTVSSAFTRHLMQVRSCHGRLCTGQTRFSPTA